MKTVLILAIVLVAFASEVFAAQGQHIKKAVLTARSGQVVAEGQDNDCDGSQSNIVAKVNVQDLSVTHITLTTCDGKTMRVAISDISSMQELEVTSPRDAASGQATSKRSGKAVADSIAVGETGAQKTTGTGMGSGKATFQDFHFVVNSKGEIQKASSSSDAQARAKTSEAKNTIGTISEAQRGDKSSPKLAKSAGEPAPSTFAVSIKVNKDKGTISIESFSFGASNSGSR